MARTLNRRMTSDNNGPHFRCRNHLAPVWLRNNGATFYDSWANISLFGPIWKNLKQHVDLTMYIYCDIERKLFLSRCFYKILHVSMKRPIKNKNKNLKIELLVRHSFAKDFVKIMKVTFNYLSHWYLRADKDFLYSKLKKIFFPYHSTWFL